MDDPEPHQGKKRRRNHARRSLGVLFACVPFFLLILSTMSASSYGTWGKIVGVVFVSAALFVAALNLHLNVVRPWLYQRAHGSMEGFKNVSHLPLFGLLLVLLGGFFGRGSLPCAVLGVVALILDTGGIPWFVVATWRDSSFWDE
jgi:hypothetical protein